MKDVRPVSRFNFCLWMSSCLSTICCENYLFSIELCLLVCQRSVDYICVGLFQDSLFYSIDLFVSFTVCFSSLRNNSFDAQIVPCQAIGSPIGSLLYSRAPVVFDYFLAFWYMMAQAYLDFSRCFSKDSLVILSVILRP